MAISHAVLSQWPTRTPKARILAEKREFDKAWAAYDIAIRIDPERADYYVSRGNCRLLQGDRKNPLADLDQAIRLEAENSDASRIRGLIRRDQGNLGEAIDDLTVVIRLEPGSSAGPRDPWRSMEAETGVRESVERSE